MVQKLSIDDVGGCTMMNSPYQLKRIRWALRLSVRSFAELLGVNDRSLRRMERASDGKPIPEGLMEDARAFLTKSGERK